MLPLLLFSGCGGEPVPQTEACAAFVACIDARDAARDATTDTLRFEEGGACWGSPEGADLCDTSCVNGLAFLRERYRDLPSECMP